MATDAEIERALATVTATLNDQELDEFDSRRIQQVVDASLGAERHLSVDGGGGLHDTDGRRIGSIRRTDSGEWITERQNPPLSAPTQPSPRRLRRASSAPC